MPRQEMADLLMCNRLDELSRQIDKLHLGYLHTGETLEKIQQRSKLEGCIEEFLCMVPHSQKFSFTETADVLRTSATAREDFSGYRAASAWNALGAYAANLMAQPWRKEYRELKMYCGFYKHEVDSSLVGAERMLLAMGYKPSSSTTMVLEGPIDPDRVSAVSRDALVAFVECQVLKSIWEEVSGRFNCSWLDVLEFRENHICSPQTAVRSLLFLFNQRQYQEQQLAVYGTASQFHPYGPVAPLAYCYGTYAVPAQPRYLPVLAPQPYALPVYPVPAQNGHAPAVPVGRLVELDAPPARQAREDGWDYVYRDLESQGYSKDLGERPDVLEHTLMALRLEECGRVEAGPGPDSGTSTYDNVPSTPARPRRVSRSRADEERWECKACTFLNAGARDVCEMCGKSRRTGAETRPLASGGRECPKCTLVNDKGRDTCVACDSSLKNSPTYI